MPLKHGPIEATMASNASPLTPLFSMPLKHGPIEARHGTTRRASLLVVFHAPKAWPH